MSANLRTILAASAALALLSAFGAGAPAAASPLACSGTCTVLASSLAYKPPVLEITNGSSVAWDSEDTFHAQVETSLLSINSCFFVTGNKTTNTEPVTFTIDGGLLEATVGATTLPCENAVALPGGSFVVAYHCSIHPVTMRAALVVSP